MTGIIVTGHGNFATGIMSTLKLIVGEQEQIAAVDFLEEHSVEDLVANLEKAIGELGDEIIILCDLMGGSPYNNAVKLKVQETGKKIEVIAGTNVSMLISAAMGREAMDYEELTDTVQQDAKEGIVRFALAAKRQEPEEDEDGI